MDLKQAHAELSGIAQELAHLPGAHDLSGQVLASSFHLAEQSEGEETDPGSEAIAYLDAEMERLPKKAAWWLPPRNFLINQALLGYNFWRFTVLPLFPKKTAYREDLAGFVIHPTWRPASDQFVRDLDPQLAQKLVGHARQAATIQETVRLELAWIEREFSIRIPEDLQGKVIKDALPTAKRRWGVDRLRIKNRLIPLDGSAPQDL
jgi:hypothetical protein